MNKNEAVEKVNNALEKANLTKEDLFEDMTTKLKTKPFTKGHILAYASLSVIPFYLYTFFMMAVFNKMVYPEIITAFLFILGNMMIPAHFVITIKDFDEQYNFKGMKEKRKLRDYIKYSHTMVHANNCYNNKTNNKISLDIYKKISAFFQKEELENILSHNLTYEDLGLKDYFLTKSEEHSIFEEAKNNKIRIHNENRLHNQKLKEDKNKKIYKQLAQSLKNEE